MLADNHVPTERVDPFSEDLLRRIGRAHAAFCGTWMQGMKAPTTEQLEVGAPPPLRFLCQRAA